MAPLEPTRTRRSPIDRRPRKYRETVALRVCDLIREGLGLREIAMRPGMPRLGTLGRWLTEIAEFRELHDRAREAQAQVFRDDVGMLACVLGEPDPRVKLQMDGRKWQVAEHDKVAGKRDGDRDAFDAELIAQLEEGLKRADRMEARDAERAAAAKGEAEGKEGDGVGAQSPGGGSLLRAEERE